ncbi:Ig-like domain-containing protein [Dyadobacter sp. CY347]|uniref:Ig-like domain-containing protein n=1 Tax=Dyadobacter sp. CY347 TaxID=2909336 RepID=UPI001F3F7526|nr:Ig-like domain-containing protein [Dyadobacter sp. CY347]MCF2491603.1 Ig-like domain-containing protein [Dyadobacter sp. CY347]
MKKFSPFILFLFLFVQQVFAQTKTVYFIGNSVTDAINISGLKSLSATTGKTLNWGRHMIPGAPLDWIWDHPDGGFSEEPYGLYPNALANYTFDAVSFQPFDRRDDEDITAIQNFVNAAGARKATCQYYIYQRWPRAPNNIDNVSDPSLTAAVWNSAWTATYTGPGNWDNTVETRSYFETLTSGFRTSVSGIIKPLMVPVGQVFYQLNLKMAAGQIPGYSKIWNVYSDGIHMNNAGNYIASCTYYATLFKADPRGLSVPSEFGSLSAAFVTAVQQTVYEVVTGYKDASNNTWSGYNAASVPVASVSISPASITIAAGATTQLTATVLPANATNKTVLWSSSNTAVATVSTSGVVTGASGGSVVITATTADGAKTATSAITVTANTGNVAVTSVAVTPNSANVNPGATTQLTATIAPANATNKTVTWSSSNASVATVSATGLVTGVASGNATITATTQDGSKTSSSSVVINAKPVAVISASATSGNAPLTVNFTSGSSSDPNSGDIVLGFEWNFGDGSANSNANSPSKTFSTPGTYTVTLRVVDNHDLYSNPVTTTITVNGSGSASNIAGSGTAYIWSDIPSASSTSDATKTANTAINNGNTSVDVVLNDVSADGNWQAAGIVWAANQSNVASVKFFNGVCAALADNGVFSANIKLQSSSNGTTWADVSGWTVSPAYPYSTAASNQTYTFSGAALNNIRGLRVIGKVRTNDSWSIKVKEVEVYTAVANVAVSSVSLAPATLSVNVGSTANLTATVSPANATNKSVSYASSNTAVATVNASGVVSGVSAGTSTITVTTADGAKTATSAVTVSAPSTTATITFTGLADGLLANPFNDASGYTLLGTYVPSSDNDPLVVLTTGSNKVIRNNNSGSKVTLTKTGGGAFNLASLKHASDPWGGLADAVITGTYAAGGTVTANISSASTTLQTATLNWNGLSQVVIDFNAGSNNSYGMLDDFIVSSGTSSNVAVASVSLSPSTLSLAAGSTGSLTATVLPSNATNKSVSYTSSSTAVATVNASGVVTGVAAGSATITVTTVDGSKTATATVTVTASNVAVTSVSLSPAAVSLAVGGTAALTATVSPSNATNKNVTYSSSNTGIATVSAGGLVSALAAGSAVITVTTVSGAKTATSTITVTAQQAQASRIGINLANPGLDYGSDVVFADAMKSSRQWDKINSTSTDGDDAPKDANYWPTTDARCLVWADAPLTHGTYKLYFTGQATVTTGDGALSSITYNSALNQSTADLTISQGNSALYLSFINTKRTSASATNTGVTNVKLMRPTSPGSTQAYPENKLFCDDIISQMAPFKCVRSIGWAAVNWNQDSLWADRTLPRHARQSPPTGGKAYGWEGRGASYEYLIMFANQAQTDLWLTIPHKVTDDYVTKLARMCKYGSDGVNPYTSTQSNPVFPPLNANLKLYVEYSNETWNDDFSQTWYIYAKGKTNNAVKFDGNDSEYEWGMRYRALRSAEISMLFRNVFGSEMMNRVRPLFCTQRTYLGRTAQSMLFMDAYFNKRDSRSTWNDPHPVNYYFYGFGGSFYWNTEGPVNINTIWNSGSFNATASYNDEYGNPAGFYDVSMTESGWAKQFGLAYINYEGDSHPHFDGDEIVIRASKSGVWDSRWYQNTLDHLNVLNQVDAELSCFLSLNGTGGVDWSIRNLLNPSNSPQLAAINFSIGNNVGVTAGTMAPFTLPGAAFTTAGLWEWPKLSATGSTTIVSNTNDFSRSYLYRLPTSGTYNVKVQYSTTSTATLIIENLGQVIANVNLANTGGATLTTVPVNFMGSSNKAYSIRLVTTAGSINIQNVIMASGTASPLPVQLVSTSVEKVSGNEGDQSLYKWQTAAEVNTDRFVIERSLNGKNWTQIGEVAASGDKSALTDYTFTDDAPANGDNLYRLRMVDKDGTYSFSRVQSLAFEHAIKLYPNPVSDKLQIQGASNAKVQVLNKSGRVMINWTAMPAEGIDMQGLRSGIYLIKIIDKNGASSVQKIVKE